MKVSKIDSGNYPSKSVATNFTAKGFDPDIAAHLNKNSGKAARFLSYVGENQGEVLNILVTAVGTAIVCPAFIAFNPFSKEDKETKVYSAWRQPISALITVLTQISVTKWFNNFMAKFASTGTKEGKAHFSRADLRACPNEGYLKRIIKLEHPEWNKAQVNDEVQQRQLVAEKAEIARYRQEYAGKNINLEDLLSQEYLDKAKDQLLDDLKDKHKADIEAKFGKDVDKIGKGKLNKHLKQLLNDLAAGQNKTTQELIHETATATIEKEVTAEAVIKTIIRHFKSKNESVCDVLKNCDVKYIENAIKELHLESKFEGGLTSEQVAEEIVKRLNIVKEYEETHYLKDFMSVKNMGTKFEEVLHNVKVKKLVRSRTSDAKKVFKSMNTQLGLVVNLVTLPLTCGILNWSYPRLMEKIMPEVTSKKNGQVKEKEVDA